MKNEFIVMDKTTGNYKTMDMSIFGGLEGFLNISSNTGGNAFSDFLRQRVPYMYRADDMTASAVSSLPFDILDEEENVIDSSVDWENVLGFMPNPQKTLYLVASSLCGGAAYLYPERTSRGVYNLTYYSASTITPQIDREGLQYFDRTSQQGAVEKLAPDELIYFWLPDSGVEIGPALAHPRGNAMQAAGLIWNQNLSLTQLSTRGFVEPFIMMVEGMTLPGEKERTEKYLSSWIRNPMQSIVKIFNGQKAEILKFNAGMDALKGVFVELSRENKEAIGTAYGIPGGLFLVDASFATEFNALRKQWKSESVFTTIYKTIEETFTDQVLKGIGERNYKMRFNPQALPEFQEDENKRSASTASLTNALNTNPKIAMWVMEHVLGYDLTEEAESEFESLVQEREEQAAQIQQQEQANAEPMPDDTEDEPPAEKPAPFRSITLTMPMQEDLKTWGDMADRFYKKGKPLPIEFECKALPEEIAAVIRNRLRLVENDLDVIKAFDVDQIVQVVEAQGVEHIKALALAITQAAEKTQTQTPPPVYNITMPPISMTANMPEQKAAEIIFSPTFAPNVQASDVIVQNNTPIENKTENNITVEPAKVVIPAMPTEATIETDARGKKTLKVK